MSANQRRGISGARVKYAIHDNVDITHYDRATIRGNLDINNVFISVSSSRDAKINTPRKLFRSHHNKKYFHYVILGKY